MTVGPMKPGRLLATTKTARYSSEYVELKLTLLISLIWLRYSAPAIPAKKADVAKTSIRVTFTDNPAVVSPFVESAIARRYRPRRARRRPTRAAAHTATTAR